MMKPWMPLFLAFGAPFLLWQAFDHGVLARGWVALGDSFFAKYSFSLNEFRGNPLQVIHGPWYLISRLGSLGFHLTGTGPESVERFWRLGIAFNVLLILVISFWSAKILVFLKADWKRAALLSFSTATMPSLLNYSPSFTGFYALGLLAVPLMLSLYAMSSVERLPWHWTLLCAFGLGLLSSGIVFSVFAMVAFVLASTLCPTPTLNDNLKPSISTRAAHALTIASLPLSFYFLWRLYRTEMVPSLFFSILLCGGLGMLWVQLKHRLLHWNASIVFPFLLGWAVGCGRKAKFWAESLNFSRISKGGATSPAHDFEHFRAIFVSVPWIWLLVASAFIGAVMAYNRHRSERRLLFFPLFVGLFFALSVASTSNIRISLPLLPEHFGLASRYYLLFAVLPSALVFSIQKLWGQRAAGAWSFVCASVAITTVFSFTRALPPLIQDARAVEGLALKHLSQTLPATVVCGRVLYPVACARLYTQTEPHTLPPALYQELDGKYVEGASRRQDCYPHSRFLRDCLKLPTLEGRDVLYIGEPPLAEDRPPPTDTELVGESKALNLIYVKVLQSKDPAKP